MPGNENVSDASISTSNTPDGWIALDGGAKLNLNDDWNTINDTLNLTVGNYFLLFYWRNDYSTGAQGPAAIDNVSFMQVGTQPGPGEPEECEAPVITSAVSTDSTITLQWTGSTTSYEWAIVEGANWTAPNAGNLVSGTTVTINNLDKNKEYTVGVRTVCAVDEHSDWATRTIRTTNVGIDGVDAATFALFPNPASTSVTVEMAEVGTVSILDAAGRESGKWSCENGRLTIDLSGYAAGAYYVRVVSAKGTAVRKLIVR